RVSVGGQYRRVESGGRNNCRSWVNLCSLEFDGGQNLNFESATPRNGRITVSKRLIVSNVAGLVRVTRCTLMTGERPTTMMRRPLTRSGYLRPSGTVSGTEPVTRIASYSVDPQPLWPSPVSTSTFATPLRCRFSVANAASRGSISTEVTW